MIYDSIIIGCGPSGMSAAIYLTRAGKKVLVLEKESIGGQIASSSLVENYPGMINVPGSTITNNMYEQMTSFNAELEIEEVTKIIPGKVKKVVTTDNEYKTKTIIIATGSKYRLLGLDNEENLIGSGIHFCTACDGAFYKDKIVAVIGGGNSGLINALTLSDICKRVYLIQNLDKLTGEDNLIKKVEKKDNIEVFLSTIVTKIIGKEKLEKIIIETNKEEREIVLDGMFLSIGLIPQNNFVKDIITLDKNNYIVSMDTTTNIDGIYAIGDCRSKKYRQLTTAVNDGTIAALDACNYLDNYE